MVVVVSMGKCITLFDKVLNHGHVALLSGDVERTLAVEVYRIHVGTYGRVFVIGCYGIDIGRE